MDTGRTRLPLTEPDGDLDRAVGVVNAKDLLPAAVGRTSTCARSPARCRASPRAPVWTSCCATCAATAATWPSSSTRTGRSTGLLTLEDVLEELVGEIDDEFDPDGEPPIRREDGRVLVEGSAAVRLVARELGVALADSHESTISGHLIEALGRVPEEGETVELEGIALRVVARDDVQIVRLAVD